MFWIKKKSISGVVEAVMQSEIIKKATGVQIGAQDDLPIGFSDAEKACDVAEKLGGNYRAVEVV